MSGERAPSPLSGPSAVLTVAVLAAAVALAAWAGFAFYAPQVGELAGGREEAAVEGTTRPRDRATVEVAAYMAGEGAADGDGRPTLAQVIELFALEEDTWRCTVGENYGAAAAERAGQYVQRRLRPGEEVVLCLD